MNIASVSLTVAVAATLAAGSALAQSQLTVVNFGGANGNAQKKAYFEPFEKAGGKITAVEYNGEQAKIKAMVEAGNVTIDVASIEYADAIRLCDEGLLEPIDNAEALNWCKAWGTVPNATPRGTGWAVCAHPPHGMVPPCPMAAGTHPP